MTNKGGRPSDYKQETADSICSGIALGDSLRTVLKGESMPAMPTVFRWLREHEEFRNQYARACEERTESFSEDILDIADNGENDWMLSNRPGNDGYDLNGEALQRSRLRVDTRKWLMAKMKPKKYGDSVDVTSKGEAIKGNTIVFSDFKQQQDATGGEHSI